MNHTPTPWSASGSIIRSEKGFGIADTDPMNNGASEVDIANAAHIVRCVNSHDELVDLLREVEEIVGSWGPEEEPSWLLRVRSILNKLKGDQP
jgi:hypothetical protein